MTIDFAGLGHYLKQRARELLPQWLPGGRINGKEYECGSLNGEKGNSLKVNTETGLWSDFATGDKGGDLVSLFAAIERVDQKTAYNRLAERYHYVTTQPTANNAVAPRLIPPQKDAPPLTDFLLKNNSPTKVWEYKNTFGSVLFYVARYDKGDEKEFRPWSWSSENLWVTKAWTSDRPLYGLELLKNDKPVLIVEGEKACDAARKMQSAYNVITWMSGAKAVAKADWRPLYGKKILLWPDADEPGVTAMEQIAEILYQKCPEIKILDVSSVTEKGWDAADALDAGIKFTTWAKPLVKILKPIPLVLVPTPQGELVPFEKPTVTVNLIPDDVPHNMTFQAIWDQADVVTTKGGSPLVNADSLLKLLRHFPAFRKHIWWDEFHAKIFTTWHGETPREWRDTDETNLAAYFQREIGLTKVTEELIRRAVFAFAEQNVRHEPRDWMSTLKWDETPRIETFFIDSMGAKDNDYIRAASKNFWISLVARIFRPGCKVDTMIILEGGQGKLKSTALEIIGGKWFSETNEAPTNKDFFLAMQGKMLLEVGELDAFSKADFKTIKKVLSCKTDNFRPPFGRYTKAFPRQSVFCGSTNEHEYLDDPTGGRRFWPFKVHQINVEKIKQDRDQLFAEAIHRLNAGESWWVMPKTAKEEQESRRQADAWENIIGHWLIGKLMIEVKQLAKEALNIDAADLTRPTQLRIARILKQHQWKTNVTRESGVTRRIWIKDAVFDDE